MYLTLFFVSEDMINANARGETRGTVQSLQYVHTDEGAYSLLSGVALRYALRKQMQELFPEYKHWRGLDEFPLSNGSYGYGELRVPSQKEAVPDSFEEFQKLGEVYDDLALFGTMVTQGKGKVTFVRRSAVSVSPGISRKTFDGGQYYTRGLSADGLETQPYKGDQHYTSYAVTIKVNLVDMATRYGAVQRMLEAMFSGLSVGGNQAAHASVLTPAYAIWCLHRGEGNNLAALQHAHDCKTVQDLVNKAESFPNPGGEEIHYGTASEALERIQAQLVEIKPRIEALYSEREMGRNERKAAREKK